MNIFAPSPDPVASAQALDDRRLNKMIVESAQILSTALHLTGRGSPDIYRPGWRQHPAVLWAAADPRHYAWLYRHFLALLAEREHRTGKAGHGSRRVAAALGAHVVTSDPPERFANCTPHKDVADVHEAYRRALADKWARDARPPTWTRRGPPSFAPDCVAAELPS